MGNSVFNLSLPAILLVYASSAQAQEYDGCTPDFPCQEFTQSSGTMTTEIYEYDGRTNFTYETRLRAHTEGGPVVFDQTVYRRIDDPLALQQIEAAKTILRNQAGPAELSFELIENTDAYYEEFLDSFTEYTESYEPGGPAVVTTQTAFGNRPDGYVYFGDRGTCYDTGTTGNINGSPANGSYASCDFGEYRELAGNVVNTNTHTTSFVNHVFREFTNEDWLLHSEWELIARLTMVGFVHPVTHTAGHDMASGFLNEASSQLLRNAVAGNQVTTGLLDGVPEALGSKPLAMEQNSPIKLWGGAELANASSKAEGTMPSSNRFTTGVRGGLVFASNSPFALGVSASHGKTSIDMKNSSEAADIFLTQLGLNVKTDYENFHILAAIAHGFGEVQSQRGATKASYDMRTWAAAFELGTQVDLKGVVFTPAAGLQWVAVHTDGFAENGGAPLTGLSEDSSSVDAWLGMTVQHTWKIEDDAALHLATSLKAMHRLNDLNAATSFVWAGGLASVEATNTARYSAEISTRLTLQVSGDLSLNAQLASRFDGDGNSAHHASGGLAIRF